MSNYDRIKRMSITELAEFLSELMGGDSIDPSICRNCEKRLGYCMAEKSGHECPRDVNLEWLMSEAEDE